MKRTTLFIDPAIERELQALARRRGRPMAALVREAIAEYVGAARETGTRRLGFIAAGRSGQRDVADQHEALLFRKEAAPAKPPAPARRGARPTAKRPRRG
jgi:predicted transcriptional regulator